MNQTQFNDAMLQYELRRLNSSLQEAFNAEREAAETKFNAAMSQAVDEINRLHQLLQEKAQELEAERTHSGRLERWGDFVVNYYNTDNAELAQVKADFEAAEQRLHDGITDAITQQPATGSVDAAVTENPADADPLPDGKRAVID